MPIPAHGFFMVNSMFSPYIMLSNLLTNYALLQPGMEEHRDNLPAQQTTSDKNSRRRTRYAQMSPERKQLFLSQLRAKRAESKRQKNLRQTNTTAALTISTCSLSPQQG